MAKLEDVKETKEVLIMDEKTKKNLYLMSSDKYKRKIGNEVPKLRKTYKKAPGSYVDPINDEARNCVLVTTFVPYTKS